MESGQAMKPTRKPGAPTFAWILTLLLMLAAGAGAASSKPNVIFVLTDDFGWGDIGPYGGKFVPTPNLDRIANEGMRFANCFCTNSLCGPSRAVILTGKHSHLNGFIDNNSRFDETQQTFPKLLQKAGYETAVIGKWHLVSNPTGFDHYEVLIGQGPYYNPPMIRDGERVTHVGYTTDVITDLGLTWLKNRTAWYRECPCTR